MLKQEILNSELQINIIKWTMNKNSKIPCSTDKKIINTKSWIKPCKTSSLREILQISPCLNTQQMFFLTHEGRYTDNIRRQIRSTLVYNPRDARIIMKARIPESIEKQSFIRIDTLDGVYREGERVKSTACISTDGRRRTTAVIWSQWKQATAHKSGNLKSCDAEWDTVRCETLLQGRIKSSTKSTQTLHGNTRDTD